MSVLSNPIMDDEMQQEIENYTELKAYIAEETATLRHTILLYVVKSRLAFGDSARVMADDILNDMVREALNHAHRFDPTRPPKAWLLGIAVNLIRRRQAKQISQNQREPLIRDLYPHTQADFSDDDLFDRLSQYSSHNPERALEESQAVSDLLGLISESDQQIIRLAILDDLNGSALARRLGIAEGTARVRLHRAINRLRIARQARDKGDAHE